MHSIHTTHEKQTEQRRNLPLRVGALIAWAAGLLAILLILMATPLRAQGDYNNAVVGYAAVSEGSVNLTYSYNAAGGDITVTNPETGKYTVTFEGAGDILEGGGHVQATPVGTDTEAHCAASGWSGNPDLEVGILCEEIDGTEWINTNFTILVLDKFAPGAGHNENLAFAQSVGGLAPDEEVDLSSFSTTHNPGGGSTVLHYDGDGIFRVVFEDLANAIPANDVGYPQVTLFIDDDTPFISFSCKANNPELVGGDYEVTIICGQFNGLPSNGRFNLLLTSGEKVAPGYAYASVPPAVEIPSDWTELSTAYNPFGSVEMRKDSPDMVHVRFNGLNTEGTGGNFVVSSPGFCNVDNWGTLFGIHFVSVAECNGSPFTVLSTFVNAMPVAVEATPRQLADVLTTPSPNPVRGTASFSVAVKQGQNISVEVFDVMGRRVKTLYNAPLAAGMAETLELDASALPAGVYIIRATGEDFAKTRRVTVVK